MPPGWKPCRRTYRTAPPPRRCRRSATSTSLNSRRSFRPAASAEIDQRDVRSAREPALSRTAPDRPTSPAPHRTALAPAAQPQPAPPGRALPSAPFTRGVNFGRRSGVTFRRRLTGLGGRWPGEDCCGVCVAEADAVTGQVGEVLQEGAEAVDGLAVFRALARSLAACGGRDFGLGDGR